MELIFMVGISGSGKSTIAKKFATLFNYEYVSSDDKRKEWYGDEEDQSHNFELFCRLEHLVANLLNDGKSVVLDATNISRKSRKRFVKLAQLPDVHLSAIVVHTPIEIAKARNASRERSVPDYVIERQFNALQIPNEAEGFRTVFHINNETDHT